MSKSLQTAKIEELLKIYKRYKKMFKDSNDKSEGSKAERFWIGVITKDLKWVLDDSKLLNEEYE